MSVSTNASLCYGISFPEETEFPWDDLRYDNGIHDWWREVRGFVPSVDPWDEDGYLKAGYGPEAEMTYFRDERTWDEQNPVPVKLRYCSVDYPIYILAIPNACVTTSGGYPKRLDTVDTTLTLCVEEADVEALERFCEEFNIEFGDDQMGWWLASYTD